METIATHIKTQIPHLVAGKNNPKLKTTLINLHVHINGDLCQ
jgi:hypothetical protein